MNKLLILNKNRLFITNYLHIYAVKNYWSHFKINTDRKHEILKDILFDYLPSTFDKYELPENVEFETEADLVDNFIKGYIVNLLPYRIRNVLAKYKSTLRKEISLPYVNNDDNTTNYKVLNKDGEAIKISCLNDIPDDGLNPEEEYMLKLVSEFNTSLYNEMANFCRNDPDDLFILSELKQGRNGNSIATKLNIPIASGNRKVNRMKFRFACLAATKDFFSLRIELKGLNLFPNECDRYFGKFKLDEKPSRDLLISIACQNRDKIRIEKVNKDTTIMDPVELQNLVFQYDPKSRQLKQKNNKSPVYSCRKDFNNKDHDKAKVYVLPNGFMYDHVTKISIHIKEKLGVK